jgi:acetyl coenzyme A synthetase (ADP forming)-like protein
MMMMSRGDLGALFEPSSVAVIGASRHPGKVGYRILANLAEGGYGGEIVPVNPKAERLQGRTSYGRLQDFPGSVDLAVIALPPDLVAEAVRDCVRAGVKALAVVTAGFREKGPEGKRREEEIARLCAAQRIPLLGPNCMGVINTAISMNASFAGSLPSRGGVSMFSQSGALTAAFLDEAARRKVGLAKVVSIGNKADLSEVDFLLALARDRDTRVIVGYLEDIRSGDDFVSAAEEASLAKPVILMKAGTTEAGLRSASSHTGALSGGEIAHGAAFRRSGVIRADSFGALFDYAALVATQPLPRGERVLIVASAGGPGTITADAAAVAGLDVATPGGGARSDNPVVVLGDAEPERYGEALRAAVADEGADAVILVLAPTSMSRPLETLRAVTDSLGGDKPVLAVLLGGRDALPGGEELAGSGLPDYDSPESAVTALKAMSEYAAWLGRPPRVVTRFRVNRRRVERIITRRLRSGRKQVGEVRSKEILKAYGFQIPEGGQASSREEAVEIADGIGYPVAVKIVSPHIIHKSDIGGVRLNVTSRQEVEDAYDLMMLRVGQKAASARIEGVYIEKMLPQGLEVIIGMNRDPLFGPMLMFGLGGIFVEVMKDVTFHLAPITADEAIQMLTATRSYEILQGARGHRKVDLAAIGGGLQRISQLATDFPQVVELDINPFMVGEGGTEPCVIDARISLREEEGSG